MGNMVTNVCVKFNYDRLRTDNFCFENLRTTTRTRRCSRRTTFI